MSHSAPEDNIPSTGEENSPPQLPTPMTLTPLGTSPRDSFTASANHLVPEKSGEEGLEEDVFVVQPERRKSLFKRRVFWLVAIAAVVVVIVAVIVPVYFTVIKPKNNTVSGGSKNPDQSSSQPSPTSGPGSPKSPKGLTTGGDGSTVTTDNGTEFTYHNPFGGFCARILFSRIGKERRSHILASQGSRIRSTRSTIMLNRTRGLLLSTRRGSGGLTSFTGKPSRSPVPSNFSSLGSLVPRQCEYWRVVCVGTVHYSSALPEIPRCHR